MKKAAAILVNYAQFAHGLLAQAIARAFTPPPDIPIYDWADENVWLYSEDAAEPGPYRSNKTCWTRRLQELGRNPVMWCWDYNAQCWTKVRVTEINIQKSTQSGFTEAILNFIRWIASFVQRNVIYLVDSQDQGKKIARRLLRSLKRLDPGIFSGDSDDIKSLEFLLRGMEVIFGGSFSGTTTAQKQAPVVVSDEIEEHQKSAAGDTSATRNLKYRKKTSTGGIQFNLSKPKLQGGPINRLFNRGDREEFHIACPHCHYLQPIIPAYQNSCSQTTEIDTPFSDKFQLIDADTGQVVKTLTALEVATLAHG
jgi:phage terminase large subunit GpA-like protein